MRRRTEYRPPRNRNPLRTALRGVGRALKVTFNTRLAQCAGVAIVIFSIFAGMNLLTSSCAEHSIQCVKEGGDWSGDDLACHSK